LNKIGQLQTDFEQTLDKDTINAYKSMFKNQEQRQLITRSEQSFKHIVVQYVKINYIDNKLLPIKWLVEIQKWLNSL